MIRFLFVVDRWPPPGGRKETACHRMARALGRQKAEVTVVTRRAQSADPEGVPSLHVLHAGPFRRLSYGRALFLLRAVRLLRRRRLHYDVVVLGTRYAGPGLARRLASWLGCGVVLLRPGGTSWPPEWEGWRPGPDAGGGVKAMRVAIAAGVDEERFQPLSPAEIAEERTRLGVGEGAVVVAEVDGPRDPALPPLLRAWGEVSVHRADAAMVLIGPGDGRFVWPRRLGDHPPPQVVVPSPSDRARVLGCADVVALGAGGGGLAIRALEAMACGVTVLAPRVASLRGVLKDQHNGRLVPPADAAAWTQALGEALDNPILARAWAAEGLATARGDHRASRSAVLFLDWAARLARHPG